MKYNASEIAKITGLDEGRILVTLKLGGQITAESVIFAGSKIIIKQTAVVNTDYNQFKN